MGRQRPSGQTRLLAAAAAVFLLAAAAAPPAAAAPATPKLSAADYQQLAAGVGLAGTSSWYASRHYLLANATAIAVGKSSAAVVSALKYGRGRLVHFGHEGMFGVCCGDTGLPRLIRNAAAWAAGGLGQEASRLAGSEDWLTDGPVSNLVSWNSSAYTSVGTIPPSSLAARMTEIDLYVVDGQSNGVGQHAAAIRAFVAAGGGVVIGSQTWYFSYDHPVAQHPTNRLTLPMGLFVAADGAEVDCQVDPTAPPSQAAHVTVAQDCVEASLRRETDAPCYLPTEGELTGAVVGLAAVAQFVPRNGTGAAFWARLEAWKAASTTPTNPASSFQRRSVHGLAALARTIQYKYLPPGELEEAPDARHFPGLPPAVTQPVNQWLSRKVKGNVSEQYWQCLGLWVMAGRPATVRVPSSVVANGGALLQIGGWTDTLYHQEEWVRLPEVARSYRVASVSTTIGTALGGLIYLILPAGAQLGTLTVQVKGAIRAPMFASGVTSPSPASWARQLQQPAPWGEIGSSKLVVTSPKSYLQAVTEPKVVADWWDKVQDANAKLAGIPKQRACPMRLQPDAAIGGGWMHSGYPVMMFNVNGVSDVNVAPHTSPSPSLWGQLHELGHNHQDGLWTWDCTGEVTNNIFTVYGLYVAKGERDAERFYGGRGVDEEHRSVIRRRYFEGGPSYQKLCSDPFLFLDSYLQVAEELGLGFQLFQDTIAAFKTLPEEQRPQTDAQKVQAWVWLSSQAAGRNLAPYYRRWGWPVWQGTADSLRYLPAYRGPN